MLWTRRIWLARRTQVVLPEVGAAQYLVGAFCFLKLICCRRGSDGRGQFCRTEWEKGRAFMTSDLARIDLWSFPLKL